MVLNTSQLLASIVWNMSQLNSRCGVGFDLVRRYIKVRVDLFSGRVECPGSRDLVGKQQSTRPEPGSGTG